MVRLRSRPGEIEAAVLRDGNLLDHAITRPGAPDGVGDLHWARAGRREPSLGGTFVTLAARGPSPADGFLPDRETGHPPGEGDAVAVRVVRAALGGKGLRLTAKLDTAETDAVRDAGDGPVPRLVRAGPTAIDELLDRWPDAPLVAPSPLVAAHFARRAPRIDPVSDDDTEAALDALRDSAVVLPGGARSTIHPTPALVAIDVDTGIASRSALFATNKLLLPRLLHEIRLRNLSGAIVVDLAGLTARKRQLLGPDFAAALAADPLRPRFLGFTALGLAEIVRSRRRAPLHELFAGPHARALDAAAALLARRSAGLPPALRVGPRLARAFAEDPTIEADLAAETGRPLLLRADPSFPPEAWRIEDATPRSGNTA